ncbi:MAG: hypothetical protein IJT26_06865 [Bacteroidales bacterium]|nr:hypothetical protein [Bacteroidales bacterium]
MKKTTALPQKTGYLAPEAIQFRVEPVKCFAISDPKPYTGEGWGDDFEEDNN